MHILPKATSRNIGNKDRWMPLWTSIQKGVMLRGMSEGEGWFKIIIGMIETILQVEGGRYPFDERWGKGRCVRVQEVQHFSSLKDLLEKKGEMLKKRELLQSGYLIKLMKIYQEDLKLLYVYEHVPYSLPRYIQTHYRSDRNDIIDMSAKLFLKKLNYELTLLISELASLRIELELSADTLAITEDEKLKVFMAPRCRMGHKAEIALLALYNSKKEKITLLAEQQFNKLRNNDSPPNFVIKGNKLLFAGNTLDESLYLQGTGGAGEAPTPDTSFNTYSSNVFSSSGLNKSTASCINPQPNLRQTQSPKFGRNFNFDQNEHKAYSTRSAQKNHTRSHKNSFQYADKEREKKRYQEEDNSDARSFTHSKSIRIEFEQKVGPFQKKERKDSVKVKVTTFHQYEMEDCNPADLFGKAKSQQDIFNFFAQQNRQEHEKPQQQEEMEVPSPTNKFTRKESMPEYTYTPTTQQRNLNEKVRLAKEKAESILSRYMGGKKKAFSMNIDQ